MDSTGDLLNIMGLGEFSVKKNYYSELENKRIQFERIFSEALNGILQVDFRGNFLIVNPALWKMCNYVDYRDFTVSCKNLGHDLFYNPKIFKDFFQWLQKEDQIKGFETKFKKANGDAFYVSIDAHIQNDRGNEIIEIFVQDIDQRKKVEKEFRAAQRLYKNILNASTLVSIISTDPEGTITQFNRGAELMLGYKASELINKHSPAQFHLESEILARGKELSAKYNQEIKGFEVFIKEAKINGSERREWTYVKKNDERIVVDLAVTGIHNNHGEIIGYLGVAKDITQEKKSTTELYEAKQMVNNIIDSMPSIIIGVDSFISITHWNKEAERESGVKISDALGKNPFTLYPQLSEFQSRIIEKIDSGDIYSKKKVLFIEDDLKSYRDITVYPIITRGFKGGVIRIDDVTEQVKLEELIVQSEKMLSVGGLAAGMAHEINNPLAGIIQNTQNLERRLFSPLKKNLEVCKDLSIDFNEIITYMNKRQIEKMLDGIQNSVIRASKIVKNMLSFARKSDDAFYSTSLTELMDNTLHIAESDYNLKKDFDFKAIKIERDYEESIPLVKCDPSKIQQVFYNILKNGAEAMEFTKEPRFTLRIYSAGEFVICEVEDNGPGIKEDIRKRIFEPFYTTKGVGKGTGLGMSVSYFIISELHQGELTVESRPDHWTRFIIKLPIKE